MLKAYSPVRPRVKPVTCCLSGRQLFLLFTPVSIPRRVTSQVTLEGTSPLTMQQCHCGARLAQCGSSARPQAFVIWRRRSGEQAQFTANPLPQKSCLGRRGVEKLRWLLLLLAPSSPNLVVVGVPTLLNSFLIYSLRFPNCFRQDY